MAINDFAQAIRADHAQEHAALFDLRGNLIVERTGDSNSVSFTPQELDRACGGELIHNHPQGLSFSGEDLALAARYGLTMRVVGVTEKGLPVDYVVKMPAPSEPLAALVLSQFDSAVSQSEKQLATSALSDREWQRQARDLAVRHLAIQDGFSYQRTASVNEMSRTPEMARLDVLSAVEPTLRDQFIAPLVANLSHLLSQNAASNGLIPITQLAVVQHGIARLVTHAMLGRPHQDGTLQPYVVQQGAIIPRSDYFAALYGLMRSAATAAVERHAAMMRKYLPDDLRRMYEFATLTPFAGTAVNENDDGMDYDPLHLWVGSDGKKLSDRIWNAAGDMRAKLDAYLSGAIARGLPVVDMARGLEAFLVEGKGGYEAMRLAVSETAAAGHRADWLAAQGNPFVETYSPRVSPSHKEYDECDVQQAGGPYPKSDPSHMPIFHPWCLCSVVWNEVSDAKAVVIKLRQLVEQAIGASKKAVTDIVGPLSKRFTDLLFRSGG